MGKRVTMVAEIVEDNCTGCNLCVFVCPTVALSMRPRGVHEPGPGRTIAALNEADCYNAQNCLELCPDDAIVMRELDEPFEIGVDVADADPSAVMHICMQAGLTADMLVCVCTETLAGEIAAAIANGASSPEELSLRTGVRTGCTEICADPILRMLQAAGHESPRNPPNGYQWYGIPGRLLEHVDDEGNVDPELVAAYPHLPLQRDANVMTMNFEEA